MSQWCCTPYSNTWRQKNRKHTMYLLTEWEGWTGKYLAWGHGVRAERHDLKPNIFHPARPNSVNKHFIIWPPPRFSFFSFSFRVIKFGMFAYVAHFDRKMHLARAIDKIPVRGPYAILAGPDGFFRPCLRHRVRPSYRDFLNTFAMKAPTEPYGSYYNCLY